jgi:hypothetical protein
MDKLALVILGSGYTGHFLAARAAPQYPSLFLTSRNPVKHMQDVPAHQRIEFDLERPATWAHIPPKADLLWLFPAAPLELVQQFAAAVNASSRQIVVLGSTSAYDVGGSQDYPPGWLDESAPIDLSKPRVQGEEFLRTNCGAIVLRVAGIYGPGRNPLDWMKSGRVGPSRKYVNLIHVNDLALTCLAALERGEPGEIYNVSDGHPRTWKDICHHIRQRWNFLPPVPESFGLPGKRISNIKLLSMLDAAGISLRHSDFYQSLEQIQDETTVL